jgi:hypothetical protein
VIHPKAVSEIRSDCAQGIRSLRDIGYPIAWDFWARLDYVRQRTPLSVCRNKPCLDLLPDILPERQPSIMDQNEVAISPGQRQGLDRAA